MGAVSVIRYGARFFASAAGHQSRFRFFSRSRISVSSSSSFVGAGGLGVSIYRGITIYNPAMTAAGSILIAALAVLLDLLLARLEQYFKKRGS